MVNRLSRRTGGWEVTWDAKQGGEEGPVGLSLASSLTSQRARQPQCLESGGSPSPREQRSPGPHQLTRTRD